LVRIVSEAPLTVAVAVLMRAALGVVVGVALGAVVGAVVGVAVGTVVGVGAGLLEVVDPPQATTSNATARISVTGKERRSDIICWVLLWY
jgi:hypothetical protein